MSELKSLYLKQFIKEITYNNRNPQNLKALEFLDEKETNPEEILPEDSVLYRSRIINDLAAINKEKGFYGFDAKNSFVPPAKATKDSRANYRYIPYLYCSNNPYISLVEVRPHFNAYVSVASIVILEDIHLLDFTNMQQSEKMSDAKENFINDLSILFSKPVSGDDDITEYIPTQYIAEYVKNLGYDGIAYKSSLTPELYIDSNKNFNAVIFNYSKCKVLKSNVFHVTMNQIDANQVDSDVEHIEIVSRNQWFINEIETIL